MPVTAFQEPKGCDLSPGNFVAPKLSSSRGANGWGRQSVIKKAICLFDRRVTKRVRDRLACGFHGVIVLYLCRLDFPRSTHVNNCCTSVCGVYLRSAHANARTRRRCQRYPVFLPSIRYEPHDNSQATAPPVLLALVHEVNRQLRQSCHDGCHLPGQTLDQQITAAMSRAEIKLDRGAKCMSFMAW